MKIKAIPASYEKVAAIPPEKHIQPLKPHIFFRTIMKIASLPDLWSTHFRCRRIGMEKLGKKEPCLILMNHSSFIDLEIAASVMYPRPMSIVSTTDAFVGKHWLMRQIGCIPTKKFVADPTLVRDMLTAVKEKKCSVLMFPEAGYTFDGTALPLPESLGYCLKKLAIPVVLIRTYGAFSRDPLYNGLQRRKVPVSADVSYFLSPEEIAAMRPAELNEKLKEAFTFDSFRWQQENGIIIDEPFRADYLNRVLYKCPHCLAEDGMIGQGTSLRCNICGKSYTLTEEGFISADDGNTEFDHVPDWFGWERECVRKELEDGTYGLNIPVDICILKGTRKLYRVGEGTLQHSREGFVLDGCDGKLHYTQKPLASFSLNADYYWYEIGDVISIGDNDALYYCFPKCKEDVVAKTRLAAEELYKMVRPVRIRRGDAPPMEKNV